ncbi:MAG: hypothetical protein K6E73_09960 [Bacteroidales bacterium]|nr:hypothetical protein [Bacteroidales bacterium]
MKPNPNFLKQNDFKFFKTTSILAANQPISRPFATIIGHNPSFCFRLAGTSAATRQSCGALADLTTHLTTHAHDIAQKMLSLRDFQVHRTHPAWGVSGSRHRPLTKKIKDEIHNNKLKYNRL